MFSKDEGIRKDTNLESLAKLVSPFKEGGIVTAALSSQTSDGCGMVVLMSAKKAKELGIKPLARFVGFGVGGVEPGVMGIGPVAAVPKVMEVTGMKIEDMDVIELNEAFASQSLYCIKTLGFDMNKLNPNGGAMALGHPLGATGAILVCKAINELEEINGKYALITMCIGGGMGAAGIIEKL
jgi:acetyl-CoA acyltransferase